MADRKNVEDLEFLEVEDIEEASENIVNSYTSTDNSNSERIHNAGIAKNVEKYTEEDDSLTQERKNTEQRRQASEKRTQAPRKRRRKKKSRIKNPVLRWVCRVLVTVVVTLDILCVGLYGVMAILTFGPSKTAKEQFVMSVQETSAIGFLANWFCSEEEIKQIKERNSVKDTDEVTDASLVNVDAAASNEDIPDIQVVDVKGATYRGKLMIVKDPSRLFVGTIDDFGNKQGTVVADIAARYNAVAGVNGGEFVDGETTYTGMPVGLVMVNGEVLNGDANTTYHVTGITFDNKLVVGNMTAAQAKEKNIRDCVSISNSIGPFLVINGEAQDVTLVLQ